MADVDRDEALARVIFGDAYGSHEGLRLAQLDVARAAREHIEDSLKVYYRDLYDKAEADVERLTRERRVNVTITDVFATSDEYGYLRINVGPETAVIDPSAINVTVTDVDTAPDVDPDEALRFIHPDAYDRERKWHGEQRVRAEKAEAAMREEVAEHDKTRATVLRLTRERDEARRDVVKWQDISIRRWQERDKWKDRCEALRADVAARASDSTQPALRADLNWCLARDDQRGAK